MTTAVAEAPTATAEPAIPAEPTRDLPTLDVAVTRDDLLDALTYVKASVAKRPPMQVLLGVLIEATDDGVRVATFDYETSRTQAIVGLGTGRALLPHELLLDVVKVLDKGARVRFEADGTTFGVAVVSGDDTFTIPALPAEDYPALPDTTVGDAIATITGAQLSEGARVLVAAGRDDTLPVLTGVRVEAEADLLTFVATDRYRLAVSEVPANVTTATTMLVPASTVTALAKQLGKADAIDLSIIKGEMLVVRSGDRTATTRLLEGEFPKYRSLLPADHQSTLDVDAKVTAVKVKKAAMVARRNAAVLLELSGAGLTLRAGAAGEAQSRIKVPGATVTGEVADREADLPFSVGANPSFLLDGLDAIGKARVEVHFQTSNTRPFVLTDPGSSGFRYLLMPVRLSS